MNVYAKFRCAPLHIKKALGIFRELIKPTRTTRTRLPRPKIYRIKRLWTAESYDTVLSERIRKVRIAQNLGKTAYNGDDEAKESRKLRNELLNGLKVFVLTKDDILNIKGNGNCDTNSIDLDCLKCWIKSFYAKKMP